MRVAALGLAQGATIATLYDAAKRVGLAPGPLDLAAHLRLQFVDQVEAPAADPNGPRRAPPGSITVASVWTRDDEDLPKGFYLRCFEGALWLRGYRADAEHVWDPDDRFVFCGM